MTKGVIILEYDILLVDKQHEEEIWHINIQLKEERKHIWRHIWT